jgi:hypothetical protein
MDDTTEFTKTDKALAAQYSSGDSKVFNVSIRGWIALFVVSTVCAMGLTQIEVKEPLYTLSVAIVSFYYGQNLKKV